MAEDEESFVGGEGDFVVAVEAATALTSTLRVPVKPARLKREPTFTPHQRPEPTTPEKGGAEHSTESFDTL